MKGYENSKVPWLFELLEERGIKAKELANATGISAGSITDWKVGKSAPTGARLTAIAEYLNVNVEYLMSGNKNAITSGDDETEIELSEEQKAKDKAEAERIIKSISETLNSLSNNDLNKVQQIIDVIAK